MFIERLSRKEYFLTCTWQLALMTTLTCAVSCPPLRSNILRPFLGIWDFQLPFVTELTPGINPVEIIQSPLPALFPAHLHLIKMKPNRLNPNIGINAYF